MFSNSGQMTSPSIQYEFGYTLSFKSSQSNFWLVRLRSSSTSWPWILCLLYRRTRRPAAVHNFGNRLHKSHRQHLEQLLPTDLCSEQSRTGRDIAPYRLLSDFSHPSSEPSFQLIIHHYTYNPGLAVSTLKKQAEELSSSPSTFVWT